MSELLQAHNFCKNIRKWKSGLQPMPYREAFVRELPEVWADIPARIYLQRVHIAEHLLRMLHSVRLPLAEIAVENSATYSQVMRVTTSEQRGPATKLPIVLHITRSHAHAPEFTQSRYQTVGCRHRPPTPTHPQPQSHTGSNISTHATRTFPFPRGRPAPAPNNTPPDLTLLPLSLAP